MATITVKALGGDFDNLAAALADADTGDGDTIEISGTWAADDTAAATITDDDITIQAVGSSKCAPNPVANPTHYRLRADAAAGVITTTIGKHSTGPVIDGLEIKNTSADANAHGILNSDFASYALNITVKNCVIYAAAAKTGQRGIRIQCNAATAQTINIENCIFFLWGRDAVYVGISNSNAAAQTTCNINSCTAYACATVDDTYYGIHGRITLNNANIYFNIFNTVVLGSTKSGDYGANGTHHARVIWDIHNSIDSDGTIAGKDGAAFECLASRTATDDDDPGAGNWVVFEDITNAPYDLRLQTSADNDAQDAHARNSGAGINMPATDIVGTARPQNTDYDIGAFEIAAVSSSSSSAASTSSSASASTSSSQSASASTSSSASASTSSSASASTSSSASASASASSSSSSASQSSSSSSASLSASSSSSSASASDSSSSSSASTSDSSSSSSASTSVSSSSSSSQSTSTSSSSSSSTTSKSSSSSSSASTSASSSSSCSSSSSSASMSVSSSSSSQSDSSSSSSQSTSSSSSSQSPSSSSSCSSSSSSSSSSASISSSSSSSQSDSSSSSCSSSSSSSSQSVSSSSSCSSSQSFSSSSSSSSSQSASSSSSSSRVVTAIEIKIYNALMAHAPLRTLVDERIFPDDAIQNLGLPSIIYQRVSGYRVNSLSGYSRLENPRFQFNIYSRLVDDLRTIFDAMLAALEAATTFTAVPDDSPWDDYDPVVDIYRRVVTIGFWNDERV